MIAALFALALQTVLPQDPVESAVGIARTLRRAYASTQDAEIRLRLDATLDSMSDRAVAALVGAPEDPDAVVFRLHDSQNLTVRPKDVRSADFLDWTVGGGRLLGIVDGLEDPLKGLLDEEMFFDLLKNWTGAANWETSTLARTAEGKTLVQGPALLQQKVSWVIRTLEKDLLPGYRVSFHLFASADPLALPLQTDGAISDETWEQLCRQAEEGKLLRRLSALDLASQLDQTVSGFSGVRRQPENLAVPKLPDGFAVQVRMLPSGSHVMLDVRAAWTQVLGVDTLTTEKGVFRFPRVAETVLQDLRTFPIGKVAVLGRMGSLPPEAGPLAILTVLARVSKTQP